MRTTNQQHQQCIRQLVKQKAAAFYNSQNNQLSGVDPSETIEFEQHEQSLQALSLDEQMNAPKSVRTHHQPPRKQQQAATTNNETALLLDNSAGSTSSCSSVSSTSSPSSSSSLIMDTKDLYDFSNPVTAASSQNQPNSRMANYNMVSPFLTYVHNKNNLVIY